MGLNGVVALDGPSGTGKSTVARRLAGRLGAGYLDTGAMYRAVTLAVLRADVDPQDAARVAELAGTLAVEIGSDPAVQSVRLGGEDVATEIRDQPVTLAVSAVSAVPRVRELMVAEQQRIIVEVLDRLGGIVVEGRDIGAVVAPDARLKVYLTASSEERAKRRTRQDTRAGRTSTVDETRLDVDRRDRLDSSRAVSPLRRADDAVELDTSNLDAWGVVDTLLGMVERRGMRVCRVGG